MEKFLYPVLVVCSISIFNLNAFGNDIQKPQTPQVVDVVTAIDAGAQLGYYEVRKDGEKVFHAIHVVDKGLTPVLKSDAITAGAALSETGQKIGDSIKNSYDFGNLSQPQDQDAAHAIGDTAVGTGHVIANGAVQIGKAGKAIFVNPLRKFGRMLAGSAHDSFAGKENDDLVSISVHGSEMIADISVRSSKSMIDYFKTFGSDMKKVGDHYIIPIRDEATREKLAQQANPVPAQVGPDQTLSTNQGADSQAPKAAPVIGGPALRESCASGTGLHDDLCVLTVGSATAAQ